jgi:sugar transferase (PEP-CTERM system associated)
LAKIWHDAATFDVVYSVTGSLRIANISRHMQRIDTSAMERQTTPLDGAGAPPALDGTSDMAQAPASKVGQIATPSASYSGFHPKVLPPSQPPRYPSRRMRFLKLSLTTTGTVLFALDMALVVLAWPLVMWAARPTVSTPLAIPMDLRGLAYPVLDLLVFYAMGLYRREALVAGWQVLARLPLVVGMGAVITVLLAEALSALNSELFLRVGGRDQAVGFALALVCFTFCAFLARLILQILLARRVLHRRVMVVGAGQRAWELLHMLGKEGSNLHYDVTFLHHPTLGDVDPRLEGDAGRPVMHLVDFGVLQAARQVDADEIVVAPDERRGMDLRRLLDCKKAGFPVLQYLSFVEREIRRVDLKRMELSWLLYSDGFHFGALDRFLKRGFDLVMSLLVLFLTAPCLLVAMLAVRWDSPGPIFYRQERVTKGGQIFWITKLRTMRADAEAQGGAVWAAAKDNRITRVGAFLRRSRIDELPQLLNILRGEMSFVGPRPERPVFVAELGNQIPLYHERHLVKAGLTGWAQINYPYGASIDDARSKLSFDLYYVKNFSIVFDLVILLQTLRVVLWPSGVR